MKSYFYSGTTIVQNGKLIKFNGIFENPQRKTHVEIYQEIIKEKRSEFECEVVLIAFNELPEQDNKPLPLAAKCECGIIWADDHSAFRNGTEDAVCNCGLKLKFEKELD